MAPGLVRKLRDGLKRSVDQILRVGGKVAPGLVARLITLALPFPRVYIFLARAAGLRTEVTQRTWRVRHGPLAGFLLTGLFPEEIAPVLAGTMEARSSNLVSALGLAGATAIDVGAGFGYYTLILSRAVGRDGHVYSFEPDYGSFQRLIRNLAINGISNATALPVCLSDRAGFARWLSFADTPWNSRLLETSARGLSAESIILWTTTLDEFLCSMGLLDRVTFAKIDVEGAELMVLQGMRRVLREAKPPVLIEVHGQAITKKVLSHLAGAQYAWEFVERASEERQHVLVFPMSSGDLYRRLLPALNG